MHMRAANVGSLWSAGLGLVLAIGLVAVISSRSGTYRLSNLDLGNTEFADTYLMFSKLESGKGYVVNRRDATVRRSDNNQPGRKWDIFRISDEANGSPSSTWLVQSKRKGKGTVFFVPLAGVKDWTYPFLYQFVRNHRPDLDLPEVRWTQLFVNRLYQGLYLKVALPFDLRKKDGGSGILRELLTIQDNKLTYVNTRFNDRRGLYLSSVADGFFPKLAPLPPTLAWLSQRCPAKGTTLLISNRPPHELSLLPLPVSMPALFEKKNGRSPAGFEDDRLRQWTVEARRMVPGVRQPFSEAEIAALEAEFGQYQDSFRKALQVHGMLHQNLVALREELPGRQAAVADLPLSLNE